MLTQVAIHIVTISILIATYNIAICRALFGAYLYNLNQQLLTQTKKDAVVRYILGSAPANKAIIEKIDTLLEQKGVDDIYESVICR